MVPQVIPVQQGKVPRVQLAMVPQVTPVQQGKVPQVQQDLPVLLEVQEIQEILDQQGKVLRAILVILVPQVKVLLVILVQQVKVLRVRQGLPVILVPQVIPVQQGKVPRVQLAMVPQVIPVQQGKVPPVQRDLPVLLEVQEIRVIPDRQGMVPQVIQAALEIQVQQDMVRQEILVILAQLDRRAAPVILALQVLPVSLAQLVLQVVQGRLVLLVL